MYILYVNMFFSRYKILNTSKCIFFCFNSQLAIVVATTCLQNLAIQTNDLLPDANHVPRPEQCRPRATASRRSKFPRQCIYTEICVILFVFNCVSSLLNCRYYTSYFFQFIIFTMFSYRHFTEKQRDMASTYVIVTYIHASLDLNATCARTTKHLFFVDREFGLKPMFSCTRTSLD